MKAFDLRISDKLDKVYFNSISWFNMRFVFIGAKNYAYFIILVALSIIKSWYYCLICVLFIIISAGVGVSLHLSSAEFISYIVLVGLCLFVSTVVLIALLLLLKLHVKLSLLGFTTFEYIQYLNFRKSRVLQLK